MAARDLGWGGIANTNRNRSFAGKTPAPVLATTTAGGGARRWRNFAYTFLLIALGRF